MAAAAQQTEFRIALTEAEELQVQELREKYSAGSRAGNEPTPAPTPASVSAAPATSTCRMCISCQGAGVTLESYDCRVLQRTCAECGGEGTRVGAKPAAVAPPQAAAASAGRAPSTAAYRLEKYEQELAELKVSLAACTDEAELKLRGALTLELERQVLRLRSQAAAVTAPAATPSTAA